MTKNIVSNNKMFAKLMPHNDRGENLHLIPIHGTKKYHGTQLFNLPNKLTFAIYSPDGEPINCIKSDIIDNDDDVENSGNDDDDDNDYYNRSLSMKFTAVEFHLEDYMEATLREQGALCNKISRCFTCFKIKNNLNLFYLFF